MPTAGKELVCLNATPYNHVVSRCVRWAFLCGGDLFSTTEQFGRRFLQGLGFGRALFPEPG